MEKKEYVKPKIERKAIFVEGGGHMGLSGKNTQPLFLNKIEV